MSEMSSFEKAKELAIAKGKLPEYFRGFSHEQTICDPRFFKALGKALGWKQSIGCGCLYENQSLCCHGISGSKCTWCVRDNPDRRKEAYDWRHHAHQYFDLVLTGGDVEKFLKELLKGKV